MELIDGDKEAPRSEMVKGLGEQAQQQAEQPQQQAPPEVTPEMLSLVQGGAGP